jgi:hypothetical protein
MKYAILIYGNEAQWDALSESETTAVYDAYMRYTQELVDAGCLRGGEELKPVRTATTLRHKDGRLLTTDGPFAETKEQLGGFYLIDVPDLDQALHWAGRCPGVGMGSVEVRPVNLMPEP